MTRVTVTFTISLPPQMAEEVETACKQEHRTRSELIREALRRYIVVDASVRARNPIRPHIEGLEPVLEL